ncbi:hypothetical protein ABAC402_15630 [Asticcacaulis sp. AC402]|nr:hypothetical protein ABAC402_15630 [Asticcacaulis sp. AC402]
MIDRKAKSLVNHSGPFFAKHRNWFVGMVLAHSPESDVAFSTTRASGPGGQYVNKTDSAVRAVHRPTGFVATAQEQRSQHANRKLATLKLALLLEERSLEAGAHARRDQWSVQQSLERGNPVRTYTGPLFKLKVAK